MGAHSSLYQALVWSPQSLLHHSPWLQPGSASSPGPSLPPVQSQLEGLLDGLHIVQNIVSTQGYKPIKLLGFIGEVHHTIGGIWPIDVKVPKGLLFSCLSLHT